MEGKACGGCCFWAPIEGEKKLGNCRRFPPQMAMDAAVDWQTGKCTVFPAFWPATEEVDWCGEYQKQVPTESVYEKRGFLTL